MMDKRYTLLFITMLVTCTTSWSQVKIGTSGGAPVDSIASIIHDSSQYRAYYLLSRRTDPKDIIRKEGITVLQIGKHGYVKNMDYASLRTDSLTRAAARAHESLSSIFGMAMSLGDQVVYDVDLTFSPRENQFIVQEKIPLSERFQYTDDVKDLQWTLIEGDTIVEDQKCQKALTTFRGRDYVAWYAPKIALPYGPYKFFGLPGLILCIYDTDRDYVFTLVGLETIKYYDPIFTRKKVIKESRKNIQEMMANYHADPSISIRNKKSIKITEEDLANIKPKPYNPIERQ